MLQYSLQWWWFYRSIVCCCPRWVRVKVPQVRNDAKILVDVTWAPIAWRNMVNFYSVRLGSTHVSFWDLFGASIHFGYLYTTFEGCMKNSCYGLTTYLKFCDEFRDLAHVISKLYHASSWGLSWFIVSCLAEDKHIFMAFIRRVNLIGYISQGGVMFPY